MIEQYLSVLRLSVLGLLLSACWADSTRHTMVEWMIPSSHMRSFQRPTLFASLFFAYLGLSHPTLHLAAGRFIPFINLWVIGS